jgi:protein-disulfide isomerase
MLSRRDYLTAVSSLTFVGLAGCSSNTSRPDPPADGQGVESLPRPALGDSADEASATMKVFEDYMCPHCAEFNSTVLPTVKNQYVNDSSSFRLEFYDFPLPVSARWSWRLAMAGRAIQDLAGVQTFWNYHNTIFNYQNRMSDQIIQDVAQQIGVDGSEVIHKTNNNIYQPVVLSDKKAGQDIGVSGTPSVFVNGEKVSRPTRQTVISKIESSL